LSLRGTLKIKKKKKKKKEEEQEPFSHKAKREIYETSRFRAPLIEKRELNAQGMFTDYAGYVIIRISQMELKEIRCSRFAENSCLYQSRGR